MVSISKARVKLDDWCCEADLLLCPRCGSFNLHHSRVRVYSGGDTYISIGKETDGSDKLTTSQDSGNPSSRSEGIVINFWCEGCSIGTGELIELTLAQHKGDTQIGWRYQPIPMEHLQPIE